MENPPSSDVARRRGVMLISLGGVLLAIVLLLGSALALHPPRAGFGSRAGVQVIVFGVFAAAIGAAAMLSGLAQMRRQRVNRRGMYLIAALGFALVVAIQWLGR